MYSLDTLVTVVDSTSFLDEVRKADDLEERGLESGEGDTRTIADLLMSQASVRDGPARRQYLRFVTCGFESGDISVVPAQGSPPSSTCLW